MKQANRIFISYSHRGNGPEWKALLLRHLGVFERHNLIDVWQDGKIRVSSYWDDDITQAMSSARIAIVLLTPEALESQYILEKELPFLRERQQHGKLTVFPVICEPCDWKIHDWLRATQAPNESNPISQLSKAEQDHIFRQLATDIATKLSWIALDELPKSDQPPPPDHIYIEKFPLTRGPGLHDEKLLGREQELALLDLAFAQPETVILSLVAWGGVGKTMLAKHWLKRLQQNNWFCTKRVFAWSFYSQGIKEDRQVSDDLFLSQALEWFGMECEPTLSPWDKGRLLADAITREPTLLVLDGIEPLQYPPGPMGGQLRAPGVQSLLIHLASKPTTLNPQSSTINQALCMVTTREPLTDLTDFQRRKGSPWGSVLRVDLGNLTDEAGSALLYHVGATRSGAAEIKPDDKELLAASQEVDGHALTINLLGRFLARAHGGDILRRDLVKFEEADREEQGGTTFKMLTVFENWFAKGGEFGLRQLAILRILGLFDRPADAGCINALRKIPVIAGLTDPLFQTRLDSSNRKANLQPLAEEDWNTAISFLADFALVMIQIDGVNNLRSLDCHPLIREYFQKQAVVRNHEAWNSAHRRLYKYLCETAPNCTKKDKMGEKMKRRLLGADRDSNRQPTIEDLQPLYQAVIHGCHAELHEEVFDKIYVNRIMRGTDSTYGFYSTRRLGAFSSDLAAVACFFETPWSRLSPVLKIADKAWLLNGAASYLQALGRLTEALEPMQAGLEMDLNREDWKNAAISVGNLSELKLRLGNIDEAIGDAEQSVVYADKSGLAFHRMDQRSDLAYALHQAGRPVEARIHFSEAEDLVMQVANRPLLHSIPGFNYCDLLLSEAERSIWQLFINSKHRIVPLNFNDVFLSVEDRAATVLQWDSIYGRLLDLGLHHVTLGRSGLFRVILEGSKIRNKRVWNFDPGLLSEIEMAVSTLRSSGYLDYLPLSILTRAWLRWLNGDPYGAQIDLDEAWGIAERGAMRLHMTDIHLYRARLFFREKEYPWKEGKNIYGEFVSNRGPSDDLAAAENLINDCGYHRRDEELADAKYAILGI